MDLFRRIGTQKKKFKVQFFIGRLKFSSYRSGKIYIVIKRGDHKVKSQQRLQMSQDCKLNFNKQILEIQATLYFDQKEKIYQEKNGQLSVVLLDQKDNKILLGDIVFDLAAYANSGQESLKENKKLQNSPKKIQGRIQFNVFVKYIGEGSQSSAEKVSGFFFGKHKDQNQTDNGKEKSKQKEAKKKTQKSPEYQKKKKTKLVPQSKSQQSCNADQNSKQRSNQMQKPSLQVQQNRSKGQYTKKSKQYETNNRPLPVSKNFVVTSSKNNNNQKAYLTSENQDQNSQKTFYFDQPLTKDTKDKKNKGVQIQKLPKPGSKAIYFGPTISKERMVQNSQQYGSQGDQDIATSEVQAVYMDHMFVKSQTQSVNTNKPLVKSQVTSLKSDPIPVKITGKNTQNSLIRENSISQQSKKSEQNSKGIWHQQKKIAEQRDRVNESHKARSTERSKDSKLPSYNRKQKQVTNIQKKKGNSIQKDREQEFEFGKKMSQDWFEKKEVNYDKKSDLEYDFTQNIPLANKFSSVKGAKKGYDTKGKQVQQYQKQVKGYQSNKFKKSIIQELIPAYSDKEKDKKKPYQSTKPNNAFEQYSVEQEQQSDKHTTTSYAIKSPNKWQNQTQKYQKLVQQNESLKQRLQYHQSTIKQLQIQLHQTQLSLDQMSSQVHYYQSQINQKEQEFQQQRNNTHKTLKNVNEDRNQIDKLLLKLKDFQKLKNQLLVDNSKLKDKYRKDFIQYEQLLEQKQSESLTNINTLKADILKLKQESSSLRSQNQKLTAQISAKVLQNTSIKTQLNALSKDSVEIKEDLSNLKLKICKLINQALANGESKTIELLMELNKH